MADFGAYFRADDGSLLVTSDTPCYELYGEHAPTSRSGNVNTYSVGCTAFPLIVVNCGAGGKAGVLAIEGSAGNWIVSVLCNLPCNILAFVPISGNVTAGYGLAAYDASGRLVFDSFRKILNVRHINALYEGASFQSTAGVNALSYTSGPVKPAKSATEQWVYVESYTYLVVTYQCTYQFQYICKDVFSCWTETVCGFVGADYMCYADSRCGFITQCGYEYVTVCGFTDTHVTELIEAKVRTTNWSIERGVASIAANGVVSFDWLLHKSGYYKEVVQYTFTNIVTNIGQIGLPSGYSPPSGFYTTNEVFEGELTKNNTFPYTSDRANTGALACITTVRSDYD
jgi:hypothetical protein